MKRYSILLGLIAFVSCTGLFVSDDDYGSISGIVYDAETNSPVAGVQLSITPGGLSDVTGSEGGFAFEGLELGSYTIHLSKNGYESKEELVTVSDSRRKDVHLTIRRTPALITTDKERMDFGSDPSVTQLSVGMVNSSYEDLEWSVIWDKTSVKWIKSVVDIYGQSEGVLGFGKTTSLVVTIDRSYLSPGENRATLIILSDNGRYEFLITAIGDGRRVGASLILPSTNINESSAILNAKVTDSGDPKYKELGFVLSTSSIPEDNIDGNYKKIVAEDPSSTTYSAKVSGLVCGEKYYVRAYVKNDIGISFSTNEEEFTTLATVTKVTTKPVSNLNPDSHTVRFNGCIDVAGVPSYIKKGFVYNIYKGNPTIDDTVIEAGGNGLGDFSVTFDKLDTYSGEHYVRAFAIQNGKVQYGDVVSFSTRERDSEVSTYSPTNITSTSVQLNGYAHDLGIPECTEIGFCYNIGEDYPTVDDNKIVASEISIGEFSYTLNNLTYSDSKIYYRAYAKQEGRVIYGDIVSFNLYCKPAQVSTAAPTELRATSVVLNGYVDSVGDPQITEMGFLYNDYGSVCYEYADNLRIIMPTVSEGLFSYKLEDIEYGHWHSYRAYVVQNGQMIVGDSQSFFPNKKSADVKTLSAIVDIDQMSVDLYGHISDIGDPGITEYGFCVDYYGEYTLFADHYPVGNSISGEYSLTLVGLEPDEEYQVLAYVVQDGEKIYGNTLYFDTYIDFEE